MIGSGRLAAGFGLVGLLVVNGSIVPSAWADSFELSNGDVIEGEILKRTLNTLTLKLESTVKLTSLAQIERVVLSLDNGEEIAGELLDWRDGVYEIRSSDKVLRIADGEIVEEMTPDEATETADVPASDQTDDADEASASTDPVAMDGLPMFTLKDGKILVGRILHATGSVLTLGPEGESALPISRAQIEAVSFKNQDGEVIWGRLAGWENGTYRLTVDDQEVLARLPDEPASAPSETAPVVTQETAENQPSEPDDAADVQSETASASPAESEQPAADGNTETAVEENTEEPADEEAVAGVAPEESGDTAPDAASAPNAADGQHIIETLVDDVDEDGEQARFTFQLSKPASQPLVVLYAAADDSAKAGEDFEAKSGVITFATGSTSAEIDVPIIDDDQGEDDEAFKLFLSGDPETVAFSQSEIAVTINDND